MSHFIHIVNLEEVLKQSNLENNREMGILSFEWGARHISSSFASPVYLDTTCAILVLSGTATLSVNYKSYTLVPKSLVMLSASQLFYFSQWEEAFRIKCLYVSPSFMDEMDPAEIINIRTKFGFRFYKCPMIQLTPEEDSLLKKRLSEVDAMLMKTEHLYYQQMLFTLMILFFLDLSNIVSRLSSSMEKATLPRYEELMKAFFELLIQYYRTEHSVDFYADRLKISSHYLSRTLKSITNLSVSDFIFEMLYSEARRMLLHSDISIKELSERLHFSDQSSFGKFFKRKAGVSPFQYRKG